MTRYGDRRLSLAASLAATALALGGCGGQDGTAAILCPSERISAAHRFDVTSLVGASLRDAAKIAAEYDCAVRVVERNGRGLFITLDHVPHRINVAVENRTITRIEDVG